MRRFGLIFFAALALSAQTYDLIPLTSQESGSLRRIDSRLAAMDPADPQRNEINAARVAIIQKAQDDRGLKCSVAFIDNTTEPYSLKCYHGPR